MAVTAASVRPDGNVSRRMVHDFNLGGTVNIGDAVYVASDGDIEQADANGAASVRAAGILVALASSDPSDTAGASGDRGTVLLEGLCYGFSGMTPGALQYISATAGALTETAPTGSGTWTFAVGRALSATILLVSPGIVAPAENA
jgi:hypothetical protein